VEGTQGENHTCVRVVVCIDGRFFFFVLKHTCVCVVVWIDGRYSCVCVCVYVCVCL
jgi:hypothetical protein